MATRHSDYAKDCFRAIECDELQVAGQKVVPGVQVAAQREVLVQSQPSAHGCTAECCFKETPAAGSLLYWDGKCLAPVLPPKEAEHTSLFGLRCRAGVAPELYPLDERTVDVSGLVEQLIALEAKVGKLEAQPPKKQPARRGRPKKVSSPAGTKTD